jgi:alpha-N-arabinofuranosidase
VKMTNIAQMVNVLQAMILTNGPDMVLTPTYHAFEMYRPFQGATALPVSYDAGKYTHGDRSVIALSISAAETPDGDLVIALVNTDARATHSIDLGALGASGFTGRILAADAMDAHNTFSEPTTVLPQPFTVRSGSSGLIATLPPHSVAVLKATD